MQVKRVVIERANRVYQCPPDVMASVITDGRPSLIRRSQAIDLASFIWPVPFEQDQLPNEKGMAPARDADLFKLKEDLAEWYDKLYRTKLNPERELFIGGGITHLVNLLTLAYIDNGDVAFVPGLGIPLYRAAVTVCNGEPISYSISSKNGWLPQFDRVGTRLGMVARLLFINSPHNPTGLELTEKDLSELIWLAGRENILLVNDFAYGAISNRKPASLLSVAGGKKVGIEIGNLSYLLGLPPLPLGYVAGHRDVIAGLKRVSELNPVHIPQYYVDIARAGLRHFPSAPLKKVRSGIADSVVAAAPLIKVAEMEQAGNNGVPFLWGKIDARASSATTARNLYRRHRLLVVPGSSFGENGEGFLRFSLTAEASQFEAAAKRIERGRMKKESEK